VDFNTDFCSPDGSYFEQIEAILALIEPMLKDVNH